MNFQNVKPVEAYQFYLDLSFRRAREAGERMRQTKLKGDRIHKSTHIELTKMQVVADTIQARMQAIVRSFPSLKDLPAFYVEMLELTLDLPQLRKSLGAVNWLGKQSRLLFNDYKRQLKRNTRFERINTLRTQYMGRLSSLVKQVKKDFIVLEEARRTMKAFPDIKPDVPTVALAGFPNVGKTTLLGRLTGANAEIDSYPFTTKGVNVASKDGVQYLDTPGTLDRLEKMNNIERIAYIAMREANRIVYVVDPTESYPLEKQKKLLDRTKKAHKDVIVFITKGDLADKEQQERAMKMFPRAITEFSRLTAILKA